MQIARFILLIPLVLLSISLHEYAHGKMADLLGDPTPGMTGRLTLNPLAHLSLMGTLVLLITQRFGWAKPVQINPRYFSNSRQGMMFVGLAGPLANIFLAVIFAVLFKNFAFNLPTVVAIFLKLGVGINLGLAIFNLIPLPPLDGSKILKGLLPRKFDKILHEIEAYGPFILLFFVFTGLLGKIIGPVWIIFYRLLL
ncbi:MULTISPECIES: site-2 protease family protein [unclassified Candidatus Frackibacter]|uniref:site-2 protease family protein n=1 Tax=unclassified Candidatus Frackibacter TaxID=2648818 RepID=UPI00079178FE|nr:MULTISPECIES: site-2 protease family protein [unclassified Candidatus Frackibacter]KXS43778.1 MAG: peptidase M50 [Candidatus Frackibacter sp. T328-2]SDC01396.1 Zn-dependent protease (includes SpoIVFB) [Candidatus Frackibacter sp. WG11]SEM32633.1 Zn-dependent protease (includes SpoIVFB) [Candidatus Frackibacter sp. WG12]SFL37596.1 Zn-dependent protease (includes SpoIVFB) [Candidatus Frackibacter sp. WG13]